MSFIRYYRVAWIFKNVFKNTFRFWLKPNHTAPDHTALEADIINPTSQGRILSPRGGGDCLSSCTLQVAKKTFTQSLHLPPPWPCSVYLPTVSDGSDMAEGHGIRLNVTGGEGGGVGPEEWGELEQGLFPSLLLSEHPSLYTALGWER